MTSMERLFAEAKEFDEDLGAWDVSACASMECMFGGYGMAFNAAKHAPWYKP